MKNFTFSTILIFLFSFQINAQDFPLRINAGGAETTYEGETFMADAYFDTGVAAARPQTGLPEPFQSFRYSPSQQLDYDIPVPDGEYTVNLYFAELWFGATGGGSGGVGSRVFDVTIEGQLAEDNLDVFASVGADAILIKTHTVTVTGGVLDIDFDSRDVVGGERHPIINAIEIAVAERPFITTWKTGEGDDIGSRQITIPAHIDETYNYTVDWGDGTSDTDVTTDITHTYDSPGTYTVSITGDFQRIDFLSSGKVLSVDQWGSMKWTSMEAAFSFCPNLDVKATDLPDLSNVTSIAGMFHDCGSLIGNESFNDWEVGNVADLRNMFGGANLFNQDLGNWDVSSATRMGHMFDGAVLFDQDLGNWDVGNVTDMRGMFWGANAFNQDLGNWDVRNVTNMEDMFRQADSFNGDISDWDVGNVTSMHRMFSWAAAFDQDLANWDVGKVTNMDEMFNEATLFDKDLSNWDVGNVTSMFGMFRGATSFDRDIGDWDVSNVVYMDGMFFNGNLSVENYEKLLNGWSSLPSLNMDVNFHAGNAQYCAAEAARDKLIDDFNWNIIDGGKTADCPDPNDLRINAGGSAVEYNGKAFIADTYFDTGLTAVRPQTGLPEPFQSFRYSPSQQMAYDIPIPDGQYTVKLYFAELWFGATGGGSGGVGSRVFDVTIEGQLSEDNLDVFAEVGAEAMLVKSHTVAVTDGVLDIDFSSLEADGGVRHPIINAIEISTAERPFIMTVGTVNKQIAVYTVDEEIYNYTVDWGDGSTDTDVTGGIVHNYAEEGNYQIAISGRFPRFVYFYEVDKFAGQLISVDQWGTSKWTSMEFAFSSLYDFEIRANDIPDLSEVRSMEGMFIDAGFTINDKINEWDVSNVTNMSRMFRFSNFNQDIGNWDVSNVTNMSQMFDRSSFNQDIGRWDVGNVTYMSYMFADSGFNQDIGHWDVSNVSTMIGMFQFARSFDQDLGNWDVSSVADMRNMFQGNSPVIGDPNPFNQNIAYWDVSNVTYMTRMFYNSDFNQDIGNWDVSNVTDMSEMFNGVALSTENYDSLLNGWSGLNLQSNVTFDAGSSQYCLGEAARQDIIDTFGWTINDGGKSVDCPDPGDFALRINTGGTEATYNDDTFMADTYFDAGVTAVRPQTGLPEPFQSFRYSPSQQMAYDIPIPDGEYTVKLYFAELWFGATGGGTGGVGSRVFDVTIEGQLAEDNLDIYALVGPEAMLVRTHNVIVSGGILDIDFSSLTVDGGVRHPVINAIEILDDNSGSSTTLAFTRPINDNVMRIAPNPVVASTTLNFERPVQLSEIQLFDAMGRLVRHYKELGMSANSTYMINTGELPPGAYFINSYDVQGNRYQKQLVVKRH